MSKSNQFRVCELISLSVSLIHRYILQDSWNYSSLTKTQCNVIMISRFVWIMPFTYKKYFIKTHRPPIAQIWTRLTTLYGKICRIVRMTFWFPTRTISTTSVHLLGAFNQQIIDKSIDHWRDKLKAVVRLNGGQIEQLFWLSRSFATLLLCSVCVLRTCMHFAIVYQAILWYCDKM